MFSYLDIFRSITLLCSAFVNHGETEDCNPIFLLEIAVWRETRLCNWCSTFLHQDSHFITDFWAARKIKPILVLHVGYDEADHDDIGDYLRILLLLLLPELNPNLKNWTLNSLRYLLDNKEPVCMWSKNENKNNLTLSQIIQLHSLAYSRQTLFQRQVSDFMKALFLFDHRKWVDE